MFQVSSSEDSNSGIDYFLIAFYQPIFDDRCGNGRPELLCCITGCGHFLLWSHFFSVQMWSFYYIISKGLYNSRIHGHNVKIKFIIFKAKTNNPLEGALLLIFTNNFIWKYIFHGRMNNCIWTISIRMIKQISVYLYFASSPQRGSISWLLS